MVGVHDVCYVWPCAADDETMVEAGVGVESKRCTGCNGRLKRGSEGRNNTGEGRLLVVGGQPLCVTVKAKSRSSPVSWMSCASSSGTLMRGEENLNHASKRVWDNGAYHPASYYKYSKPSQKYPKNPEKNRGQNSVR